MVGVSVWKGVVETPGLTTGAEFRFCSGGVNVQAATTMTMSDAARYLLALSRCGILTGCKSLARFGAGPASKLASRADFSRPETSRSVPSVGKREIVALLLVMRIRPAPVVVVSAKVLIPAPPCVTSSTMPLTKGSTVKTFASGGL